MVMQRLSVGASLAALIFALSASRLSRISRAVIASCAIVGAPVTTASSTVTPTAVNPIALSAITASVTGFAAALSVGYSPHCGLPQMRHI